MDKDTLDFIGTIITNVATIGLAVFTIWITQRRTERAREMERSLVPRTQFDLQCSFYGPERGKIIVNIHLIAHNKGSTIRGFRNIRFVILGLREDRELHLF